MITAQNITSHEIIGLHTEIIGSTNPQVIGLNGRVIDETKSMLRISSEKGIKSIAKDTSLWRFTIDDNRTVVDVAGTKIAKRPFDRIGAKA